MEPKTLPTEVIANLKAIHKSSRDKKEADIIKAIILMDDGYTLTQVSKILLMDDETVRRRVNEYLEKGKLLPQKPAWSFRNTIKSIANNLICRDEACHLP